MCARRGKGTGGEADGGRYALHRTHFLMAASATLLALAASVLRGACGEGIWVGSNSFGTDPLHAGTHELPTTTNQGHRANIRAEPAPIQKDSKHANPLMASPDVRFGVVGGGQQMISLAEGESFQYTMVLSHPPGTTRSNGVIDFAKDVVQIWLTSSQSVYQEESPGQFVEHLGHRTQLVIETASGTSESKWSHFPWDGSATGDYPDTLTDQSDGEAVLEFNSTNWHMPQTVTVTARQDDVYEPRVNRRGQEAYVHHKVVTPEGDPACGYNSNGLTCGYYNGLAVNDMVVSIEDDDPAVVLQDIDDPMPTEGGQPAFISLKLASEPMADVNVTLFSGPVRHPDVPEQVRFFAENSDAPVNHYLFTPTDWDTWRTFRIEAVDDDVDEWTYTGMFRPSEIGYKIESEDYYYRNNGTSCLHERIGSLSSLSEIQGRTHQCVCMHEDLQQVEAFKPDQYHTRGMKCGAVATPVDNNYRFVNISLVSCTAIEGGTNCDYTVRLNSAPGFNAYDWNHDLPSTVVVHIREEGEIEREALREHELFFTEWLQVPWNASSAAAVVLDEGITAADIHALGAIHEPGMNGTLSEDSNTEVCKLMNETVWPLINATCNEDDDLVHLSERGCSIACEGLVVPFFEQCVYKNEVRGLGIPEITPSAKEMIAHYRRCGGIVFDGEMIGLVWTDRSDGRAGSKTAGSSPWHRYGYQVQAGWEIDLVFDASNWNVERKISVVAFNDDVDEPDEIRTIYHTTTVAQRAKLDVYENGTFHKSDIVTNDPTYFPHNKSIEIASINVHVIDNDIADVLLGCRSFDMTSQIGSVEGYGGFEGKMPRSFRFSPGESEKEGDLACVIHTQECSPKNKSIVQLEYQEVWKPRNLTDPLNCSEWITYDDIMAACCVDHEGMGLVDCSSGMPNTCTRECATAFPDFYEACWPEVNEIMKTHANATQQAADYFQLQCIAIGIPLEEEAFISAGMSSCLPLIALLEQDFETKCCPAATCSVQHTETILLPGDCRPECSDFFTPIYQACGQVWRDTDYHLDMGAVAGFYGEEELDLVYDTCYRFEGTEVPIDWMYWHDTESCSQISEAHELALDLESRPTGEHVRLDDCYQGSLSGYLEMPVTSAGSGAKWQIEFTTVPDEGSARDVTDWIDVTVNGETQRLYNDEESSGVFTVQAPGDVLHYEITMGTGCQPGDRIADCIPDWSAACPCAQNAIEPQLHMLLLPGLARAIAPPRQAKAQTVKGNATRNATAVEDLACTLGTYTLHLNTDPGTKRIRTVRDNLSDLRRRGTVEGPAGGISSNGDMLNSAGRPGPQGGGGPFEKVWARAVPRTDYDFTLAPVVIEVTPDPTPHTRYETSHGGASCKFTRANWDKPCTVTVFPTMDPLLRTPYDVYWNTRQIVDHTAHTVTQSFFGEMHGYDDEYWNYTVPYQLYTPGPGPHGQDVGEVPTGSDSPIMDGDHLSENALELCSVRKGAFEEERYTKSAGQAAAGDVSGHEPGVYDEVVCRWGGRRTRTEGAPNKYGPNVLWNHTLYRHPIQVRYVMINTYGVPGGGDFGDVISSVPQSDPLLSFASPIAGALRDMSFGPRLEDVSDARRCANYCLRQEGCRSFDFAPQQHRCFLNSGIIDDGGMVMIDDMLPAGMQPKNVHGDSLRDGIGANRGRGTASTVALSQAYYHHYRRHVQPALSVPQDNSICPCELGPHVPDAPFGNIDTERTGFKYKAFAVPESLEDADGGVAFCIRQCCRDQERQCRSWVIREPQISANCTDDQYGEHSLDAQVSDNCRGTAMGSCVDGVSKCCFLIDDVNSADYVNRSTGSVSGRVFPDQLWTDIRGFNFMPTYAVNSVELWRDYDYYAIERELAVAARTGDFNTVRVSLSYEVWAHNSTLFGNRLQHFVATAFSRGMRTVPVVFDMTQHPNVPRCTLHAVNPDEIEDTRKCWYPSPSYTRSDDIDWWVTEGHSYMNWLIEALPSTLPGMFVWDVVSSPEDYPPPRPDARPEMPRRPAKVPNLANASTVVGTSVSGPGVSYSVPEVRCFWRACAIV